MMLMAMRRMAMAGIPRGVYLLSCALGIGMSAAVASVTIAALAGFYVTDDHGLATLPYGLQFVAVMLTSYLASLAMEKFGRKPVLLLLIACGVGSGVVGAVGVYEKSLWLLCVAHYLLGMFTTAVNMFRFASLDMVADKFKSLALSMVLSGGVVAALLGPFLVRNAEDLMWFAHGVYAAVYGVISALCAVVFFIVLGVRIARPVAKQKTAPHKNASADKIRRQVLNALLKNRAYVFAVLCGALGYGMMSMLMIASSLQMKSLGISFASISWVIQLHVFFMFAPSLFTNKLIQWLGVRRLLTAGIFTQIAASLVSILSSSTPAFFIALILLGLAWNFLYTGGSYLATRSVPEALKFKAQGINDMLVALISAGGALFAGAMLASMSWHGMNVLVVGIALIVFILRLAYLGKTNLTPAY